MKLFSELARSGIPASFKLEVCQAEPRFCFKNLCVFEQDEKQLKKFRSYWKSLEFLSR